MKQFNLAIIILIISFSAFSQEKLSINQCRKMALENNENIKKAELQIKKSKAQLTSVKTNYLPKFSASATYLYLFEDYKEDLYLPTYSPDPLTGELVPNLMINPMTGETVIGEDGIPIFNLYAMLPLEISLKGAYLADIKVEQAIYTGGKINAGKNMAKIGMEMAYENNNLQKTNCIYNTDKSYWLYVSVNEKVKLAKEYQKLLSSLVETLKNSYELGITNKNDLLKAQVKLNKANLELQKAQSGLKLSRMALCKAIGIDLSSDIIATDTIMDIDKQLINLSDNDNINSRPEYQLLKKQVSLQEEEIKLSRADFLPNAGIRAGYSYIGGIELNGSNMDFDGNTNIIASVNIPLFHWSEGIQKIKIAKLDKQIQEINFQNNVKLMNLELEQTKLNLNDALKNIEITKFSLNQAKENLKVSNDNYETGMETLTNMLQAQTLWQESYSDLIDAKINYKLKESEYLKARGKLLIKY